MMRRRNALRALVSSLASVWAFVSCAPLRKGDSPRVAGPDQALLAKKLEHDLSRLAQRNYAEEGIPMFLVCENLASKNRSSADPANHAEGIALATELRRNAAAFALIQPNATEEAVPKIMEVIAERKFGITPVRERP